MCELQFIKSLKENLNNRDINEFFKMMELGSLNNNDAFGFFNHNHLFKEKGVFNLKNFRYKKLLNENFIVGHNRLSTSGSEDNNFNNHPFILNDFVLIHNGILNNDDDLRKEFKINSKIETDSYIILWLINHYFNKSVLKNRVARMCDAIKKTTLKINGSYSVFVYDKQNKNLFYFKNSKCSFKFCLLDNKILIGSTREENLKHIYLNKKYIFDDDMFKKRVFKNAEDNKIYLINGDVVIKEVGEFEDLEVEYKFNYVYNYTPTKQKTKNKTKQNKTQNTLLNYNDDVLSDVDLYAEIDYILNNIFGYSPEFQIINDGSIIKLKDCGELNYIAGYVNYNVDKEGFVYINVDDVLNLGSVWGF